MGAALVLVVWTLSGCAGTTGQRLATAAEQQYAAMAHAAATCVAVTAQILPADKAAEYCTAALSGDVQRAVATAGAAAAAVRRVVVVAGGSYNPLGVLSFSACPTCGRVSGSVPGRW